MHENRENIFKCDLCSKSFQYKNSVKIHKRRIHDENAKQFCNQCGKLFDKHYLKSHIETLHAGEKIHACNLCNQVFAQASSLTGHVRKVHEKVEKTLKCSQCEKLFYTNGELDL